MTHSYRKLFEPYKIGNVEIENRFTVSPMMISSALFTMKI